MRFWLLAVMGLACGLMVSAVCLHHGSGTVVPLSPAHSVAALVNDTGLHHDLVSQADFAVNEPSPPGRLNDDGGSSLPEQPTIPDPPVSPSERAVREVIDRILHDAPLEERQIWFDELKELPAAVVEDLLRVRRQFGMPKPKSDSEYLPSLKATLSSPLPAVGSSSRWDETIRSLKLAREVHLHNLANANTTGYRRLIPLFCAIPFDGRDLSKEAGETRRPCLGCRFDGVRMDDVPGEVLKTGRALDVAIRGLGWFAVDHEGTRCYTRDGRFTLDDHGVLCISSCQGLLPITPPITIPRESVSVAVQTDGLVTAVKKPGAEPVECGQLQLTIFNDPSRLVHHANGLFTWPKNLSGFGEQLIEANEHIAPNSLERSSVDRDAEWREIEFIDRWLQAVR